MNVFINAGVKFKLWYMIEHLPKEVGGFGYAKIDQGDILWQDIFLVHQETTKGSVDFTGGGIAEAIERAARDGVLGSENFVWASWHSHHSMGAFWSNTDEECIETYGSTGIPLLFSFVGNHKHEYKCRLDMFGVNHCGVEVGQVTMDNLKMYDDLTDPAFKNLHDEMQEMVSDPKPEPKNKGKAGEVKQLPPPTAEQDAADSDDDPVVEVPLGHTLEEAWTIRELMDSGLSYAAARALVEEDGIEFEVGPDGEVIGYDTMAWASVDLGDD